MKIEDLIPNMRKNPFIKVRRDVWVEGKYISMDQGLVRMTYKIYDGITSDSYAFTRSDILANDWGVKK